MGNDNQFDYIIIGGGSAGALLANRLSADRRIRVLLIEAGRKDDYHWVHLPMGHLHCLHNPRTDWCLHTEAQVGLGGRRLPYPRGKTLGGNSSISPMHYLRGQAHEYAQWAQATGDDTWCWSNVLPAFQRHESHWRLDATRTTPTTPAQQAADRTVHGDKGEWRIEPQRQRWPIVEAFAQAAQQTGIAPCDDFNTGTSEGVGYFDVTQKNGLRWNAAKAFLRPRCYGRPNFELWTMAQATRLITERQANGQLRCTGAQVWTGEGALETVHATQEVLLCAGAIHSPHLLQLSGIGAAATLHQAGIALVHDLPGVGHNLQDRLQQRSTFQVQGTTTLNDMAHSPWHRLQMALQYAWQRNGPLSMAGVPLGIFARSQADLPHPDLLLQMQPFSLDTWGSKLHRFSAFTASVSPLYPSSRGSVLAQSPRFEDAPAIHPNYLATTEDQQTAIDGLRLLHRIVAQPALAAFVPQTYPQPYAPTEDQLLRHARLHSATLGHAAGTTAMGREEDLMSVLDSRLRVRGIDNLRVVGASAMPTLTSGDACSPTLMLAEKAAAWIRADHQARQAAAALQPLPPTMAPTPHTGSSTPQNLQKEKQDA